MSTEINENAVKEVFGESPNLWSQFKLKLLELFAKKVDINGGTMMADPTVGLGVATKRYADNNIKILTTIKNGYCGTVPGWDENSSKKYIPIAFVGVSNDYGTECVTILNYDRRTLVYDGSTRGIYAEVESGTGKVFLTSSNGDGDRVDLVNFIIFFPAERF